jgi:hypothetical protein
VDGKYLTRAEEEISLQDRVDEGLNNFNKLLFEEPVYAPVKAEAARGIVS